jgi:succinate dehydrogenase / fumarate reductase flavoprotein subunit
VCRCVALAALERTESRGGHTREDFPGMNPQWRGVNLICTLDNSDTVQLTRKPVPEIRQDLLELFERTELAKYLTEVELVRRDGPAAVHQTDDGSGA